MTAMVIAFFNGTPVNFPFISSKQKIFTHFEDAIKGYEDDVEFYYKQTEYWESEMNKVAINGVVSIKLEKKLANQLGFDSIERFRILFNINVYYLLKKGRIVDDENFGFIITEVPNTESNINKIISSVKSFDKILTAQMKSCGLCRQPAKTLCSKCKKIYYCCRECQVTDWKKHKMECEK